MNNSRASLHLKQQQQQKMSVTPFPREERKSHHGTNDKASIEQRHLEIRL